MPAVAAISGLLLIVATPLAQNVWSGQTRYQLHLIAYRDGEYNQHASAVC
jgi:hypothetical protein